MTTFFVLGGVAFLVLVYFIFRSGKPKEIEQEAAPSHSLYDKTPVEAVPAAGGAATLQRRRPPTTSRRRRVTRHGRSGWEIDGEFFDDLLDALWIAQYLTDYEEEFIDAEAHLEAVPDAPPFEPADGEFGGGGASGDFEPERTPVVSSPPAYDPPSYDDDSRRGGFGSGDYDSGGSSYDSGGSDFGGDSGGFDD